MRCWIISALLLALPTLAAADETFVTIQQVKGNQIAVVKDDAARGEGEDPAPAEAPRRGFGRSRRVDTPEPQSAIITVTPDVKITSASRERRTNEFRVGAELAGGLKHRIFQEMQTPLKARIVTAENRITEINVIIPETDINQSNTTANGDAVIAVRPKRPPTKRPSGAGASK